MTKAFFALLLCVLLFFVSFHALAHPGKTDSQGGHYDRSTGEYHYHHGYPAHQHPNGVCPYDFDDKTGQNSGSSSKSSGSSSVRLTATAAPFMTKKAAARVPITINQYGAVGAAIAGASVYGVVCMMCKKNT